MKFILFLLIGLIVTASGPAMAGVGADLGTPEISAPNIPKNGLFDDRKLLTGIRIEQSPDIVFEPQVGVGHAMWEREVRSGYDEVTHKFHARAGGKVELFRAVSFSAAAKIPVYTIASSDRRLAGTGPTQPGQKRYGYDILHSTNSLSWTGEMGFHVGDAAEVSIFYDKSRFDGSTVGNGLGRYEESFGTRFIFTFW